MKYFQKDVYLLAYNLLRSLMWSAGTTYGSLQIAYHYKVLAII
ncbi:hypothetical protein [Nostoc sp.]